MTRVNAWPLEIKDNADGSKKLQVKVQAEFEVDCDCDDISVKVYWHAESAGGTITAPSGASAKGDVTDPQGVPWTWTPGADGWITDSIDTNPEWNSHQCVPGTNGNKVTIADAPGIVIPAGSQGAGYSYSYESTWKVDILCNGQVIAYEYYQVSITGQGGANGPTGTRTGKQGQDALNDINQRMTANGGYTVDAEGN